MRSKQNSPFSSSVGAAIRFKKEYMNVYALFWSKTSISTLKTTEKVFVWIVLKLIFFFSFGLIFKELRNSFFQVKAFFF